LSIWGGLLLWSLYEHSASREKAGLKLERERVTAEAQVSSIFTQAEMVLVTTDRWIVDHPDADPHSDPRFVELIRALQRVTDGGMLVRLVDASGETFLVPSEGVHQGMKAEDRDYFKAAMAAPPGRISIGQAIEGRASGRWQVPVATRLTRPAHGIVLVFVGIETGLFGHVLDAVRSDKDSVLSVIRRDGILLARSSTRPVELGVSYAAFPLFTEGLAKAPRGVMLAPSTRTDGVPRMIAYGEMARYPLITLVGESVQSIDAPLWRMIWIIAGLFLPVTLAVVLSARRSIGLLAALHRREEALSRLATTDDLTGLTNRRQFLELCSEEMLRARRYRQPLAFLELDLDFFKRINDAYGHAAGDAVLKALARVGQACLRDVDHFGRLGGEEFGMLLPNTDIEGALHLAGRIVAAVAACEVPAGELVLRFTTSIGVSALDGDDQGFEEVFARADKALYEAKAGGRNCMRSVPPLLADGISDDSTKGEQQ
jgi:diguanylate cyclase (GGDEF)-like protein